MILEKAKSQTIKEINNTLAPKLIKDPLFMFFCQDINKRNDFINSYLNYYIYEWSRYDTLLYNEHSKALISLVDPKTFEYKFKGKGAHGIRKYKSSDAIFAHRENLSEIVDILVPPTRKSLTMTIYGNIEIDFPYINELIDEAIRYAENEGAILIYETFSRKLIKLMLDKGFSIASQKQFLNTQFIETVMIYNI